MSTGVWVLDAPALISYSQGYGYMVSLIGSAIRRGTLLLVPASALMEAHGTPGVDVEMLDRLVTRYSAIRVAPLSADIAHLGGELWKRHPGTALPVVHTALLARLAEAPVVTAPAERISALLEPGHPIFTPPVE